MDYEKLIDQNSDVHYINQILQKRPGDFSKLQKAIEAERAEPMPLWSSWLEKYFGSLAALSFSCGVKGLFYGLSKAIMELEQLAHDTPGATLQDLPEGSDAENVLGLLPPVYRSCYDLGFVKNLNNALVGLMIRANAGRDMRAHSVAEEILIRSAALVAFGYSYTLSRRTESEGEINFLPDIEKLGDWSNWECWHFELFEDDDLDMMLYDEAAPVPPESSYFSFDHWFDQIFFEEDDLDCSESDDVGRALFHQTENKLVRTYSCFDYNIEIFTEDDCGVPSYGAWLVKEDYVVKKFMFSVPKTSVSLEEFVEMLEYNILEHIKMYEDEYCDD